MASTNQMLQVMNASTAKRTDKKAKSENASTSKSQNTEMNSKSMEEVMQQCLNLNPSKKSGLGR